MKILKFNESYLNESRKRSPKTNLRVLIDNEEFQNPDASKTFIQVINYISKKIGSDKFLEEVSKKRLAKSHISTDENSFPPSFEDITKSETGDFYISTHSSTETKKEIIENILNDFSIKGKVDILLSQRNFEPSLSSTYKVNFKYKGKDLELKSNGVGPLYFDVADWAFGENFNFPYERGPLKLLSLDEVNYKIKNTPSLSNMSIEREFHKIKNSDKYLIRLTNQDKNERAITRILTDIGATDINPTGFTLRGKTLDDDSDKIDKLLDFKKKEPIKLEISVRNPFGGENKKAGDPYNSSALFVVGESGSGKSTRIIPLLRKSGHKIIVIGSENAPSPNLLFEYDQNQGFIPSDIGDFIINAKNDPKNFYTIIFDECHEYIDEIKRSILHAISHKRGEVRFFGVKKLARHFFDNLETYETTSKIVPDNVGFIFISSKPDVFEYHADFMGRVDKVVVKREDPYPYPDIKYIQNLLDRQDQL